MGTRILSGMATYIFSVRGEREKDNPDKKWARAVLHDRLAAGLWPLNKLTPHQRYLVAGDQVLFYVAGNADPDKHHIVAIAELAGSRVESVKSNDGLPAWIGSKALSYSVPLRKPHWLKEPISLRALVPHLSFIQNKKQWGTALQGGITRIPADDFAKIMEKRGR